ncbi:hypothetical protein L2E82_04724 [Cichorium intybus]|uniref:Uncharacterized protein n=1 Tax=Cichorium intybus TaxID=13427 RepID=A0ACB9H5T3_CICIN|nr:hypothetical protein L2E82_04724 [Cichorium intybus]
MQLLSRSKVLISMVPPRSRSSSFGFRSRHHKSLHLIRRWMVHGRVSDPIPLISTVFSVIYLDGSKIKNKEVIDYIKKVLESDAFYIPSVNGSVGLEPSEDYTTIELA